MRWDLVLLLTFNAILGRVEGVSKYLLVSIEDEKPLVDRKSSPGMLSPGWQERAREAAEERGAYDPMQTVWREIKELLMR